MWYIINASLYKLLPKSHFGSMMIDRHLKNHIRKRNERKILDVQGLETQFNTPEGVVHAVNGVSLDLQEGETLGLVGESGCGKV